MAHFDPEREAHKAWLGLVQVVERGVSLDKPPPEDTRTGKPYQTRLDPPPADPRVAHPDARGETR